MNVIMYYVVTNGGGPEAILFDAEEAFAAGFEYVYVFDDEGVETCSYALSSSVEYGDATTEDDYTII